MPFMSFMPFLTQPLIWRNPKPLQDDQIPRPRYTTKIVQKSNEIATIWGYGAPSFINGFRQKNGTVPLS